MQQKINFWGMVLLCLVCSPAFANPGDLDPGFGTQGLLELKMGKTGVNSSMFARQKDNKVLVVGGSNPAGNNEQYTIQRHLADGALDVSFGTQGKVIGDVATGLDSDQATVVAVLDNGKILVGGLFKNNADMDVFLIKLDETGKPDPGFGTGGLVTLDVGQVPNGVTDMLVLPDGRIVLALVNIVGGSAYESALVRLQADGKMDAAFGTVKAIGTTGFLPIRLLRQRDGKLVVLGAGSKGQGLQAALYRVQEDGKVDESFGDKGLSFPEIPNGILVTLSGLTDGVELPNGQWMVVGAFTSGNEMPLLMRLNADGKIDKTFGRTGISMDATTLTGTLNQVLRLAHGKFLVTGEVLGNNNSSNVLLARFLDDGGLDAGFGKNGFSDIPLEPQGNVSTSDEGVGVVFQTDGKILVLGSANGDLMLIRFEGDLLADLQATITADKTKVVVGGEVAVTLTIENKGPNEAKNIGFSNPWPADVTLKEGTLKTDRGTCTNTPVFACQLGNLKVNEKATITWTLVLSKEGNVTIQTQVGADVSDNQPGDNAPILALVVEPTPPAGGGGTSGGGSGGSGSSGGNTGGNTSGNTGGNTGNAPNNQTTTSDDGGGCGCRMSPGSQTPWSGLVLEASCVFVLVFGFLIVRMKCSSWCQ